MEEVACLLDHVQIPGVNDLVYKDECSYCFDSPECQRGLYLCLRTFVGLGREYVDEHSRRTGQRLYLHHCRLRKRVAHPVDDNSPAKRPTRMAIGLEGGFETDDSTTQFIVEERNAVVLLPQWHRIPLPESQLPFKILQCVNALLNADSAAKAEDAAAAAAGNAWDGEMRQESIYAKNLVQLENGVKVPPSGWKCFKCNLNSNLWLNLTDGTILCGRRFYDGSGGNNHAVEYFKEKGYPLAVKLGTITAEGADVFSYPEDDMVIDPLLSQHLVHFGIQAQSMCKTERTMAELEVALNEKYGEWSALQESQSELQPLYGPGLTGICNLGNSCYMASIMQVLFSIPEFINKYGTPEAARSFFEVAGSNPMGNFNAQLAKLGRGLLSGEYSCAGSNGEAEQVEESVIWPLGIRPRMFKTLIGRGHPEFCSKRQQDAQEFLLHIFSLVERNSLGATNPTVAFCFKVEDRLQCGVTSQVRYLQRDEYILSLPVPVGAASNVEEVASYERRRAACTGTQFDEPPMRLRLTLMDCLRAYAQEELVDGFVSEAAAGARVTARKRVRLATFPDYLVLQIKKFGLNEDWTPRKLDVEIELPEDDENIDLEWLRGRGLQPGEQEFPQSDERPSSSPPGQALPDPQIVLSLMDMGFPRAACEKATLLTGNCSLEAATNWVMEHMSDPDFADEPLVAALPQVQISAENIAMIESMGFSAQQAARALRATDNNSERAVDWIFSHMDELDLPEPADASTAHGASSAAASSHRDGSAQYQLLGFISHMGNSTASGHYVCHIRKNGQWVIFNDEKVAASVRPPKSLAYLYFLRRVNL